MIIKNTVDKEIFFKSTLNKLINNNFKICYVTTYRYLFIRTLDNL